MSRDLFEPSVIFTRVFAMPNAATFSILPIASLLGRYINDVKVVVDPFARFSQWGTLRNDLNPDTGAEYHMAAEGFVVHLDKIGTIADAVLFDPPYSPRQISECYQKVGLPVTTETTQNARLYKTVKDGLHKILKPGGMAICCGWNSMGFGLKRGYQMKEILMVAHGAAHNDTIVTVEEKL